jgi:hypothetical protein
MPFPEQDDERSLDFIKAWVGVQIQDLLWFWQFKQLPEGLLRRQRAPVDLGQAEELNKEVQILHRKNFLPRQEPQ